MHKAALGWLRSRIVGVIAVAGLVVVGVSLAIPAVASYQRDHLDGQTREVTLEWQCSNHIEWRQPGTSWTWVAIPTEDLPAELSASGVMNEAGGWATQQAQGELHFDSSTQATFTSIEGGTVQMERRGEPFFRTLGCAVDAPAGG